MTSISGALIDFKNLLPGSLIDVETKSRHYLIECLGGNAIRISGHPDYCPEPVPAQLQGSVGKEGGVEFGLIEPGRPLMVVLDDNRPITTSRVISVRLDKAKAQPAGLSSIH